MAKGENGSKKKRNEVRMENLSDTVFGQLQNIHSHTGQSISSMIKSRLPQIINTFPEMYYKNRKPD